MLKSIRVRLPLTYAGIALLTAAVLGSLMLAAIQQYYTQREQIYLQRNARSIADALAPVLEQDPAPEAIAEQFSTFAFLTRTHLRLLDASGRLLADTNATRNSPQMTAISIQKPTPEAEAAEDAITVEAQETIILAEDVESSIITQTNRAQGYAIGLTTPYTKTLEPIVQSFTIISDSVGGTIMISFVNNDNRSWFKVTDRDPTRLAMILSDSPLYISEASSKNSEMPTPPVSEAANAAQTISQTVSIASPVSDEKHTTQRVLISSMPAVKTMYGFSLEGAPDQETGVSDQSYALTISSTAGNVLGTIEISEGPAYGREIVANVAWAWATASLAAVLIAGFCGWLVSRRMAAPLLALNQATLQMAAGQLSTRAEAQREDEYGQLARSFNTMAEQVEETIHLLRRFASDAAHELKTPLTALHASLELARRNQEQGKATDEYLEDAYLEMTRLEGLIGNLLDLSWIEAGSASNSNEIIELPQLLQTTCEPFASQAEQADIRFDLLLPDLTLQITGQASQIRRAFSNLLENAIKFTHPGGKIEVRLTENEGWAVIEFRDTGIGIPSQDLPLIFNRFHRAQNAASYWGSGLGLAIVKAIIDGHKGKIEVESLPQGSCFRLYFPMIRAT